MGSFNSIWRLSRFIRPEYFFMVMIFSLTVGTAYATYKNIQQDGLSAISAAWTQAFGAIVTIASTAWMLRQQIIDTRRQRRSLIKENTWAVRFVIAQAQFDAQIIA